MPVVGVPKTIDNDLVGTEVTFGFHTAVQIATDAIDRLHTTAESHDRVMVVEVMGRHAGWIATYAGIAGGATVILIPEEPFDIDEVCDAAARGATSGAATPRSSSSPRAPSRRRARWPCGRARSTSSATCASAASATDRRTRSRSAPGSRRGSTVLGHVQRGGTPTAFDRVLATRFGVAAIDAVHDGAFGQMVALRAGEIVRVPLAEAVGAEDRRPGAVPRRRRGLLRLSRVKWAAQCAAQVREAPIVERQRAGAGGSEADDGDED